MNPLRLILGNQLFYPLENYDTSIPIIMIEHNDLCKNYTFHKQKIAYHRATMRKYADFLLEQNKEVVYVNATETISDIRLLLPELKKRGIQEIHFIIHLLYLSSSFVKNCFKFGAK